MIAAAAALGAACSTTPVTTTPAPTMSSSGGDVALFPDTSGMWADSAGGMWMDASGALHMGGRSGMVMGLMPASIATFTNANILAHMGEGDSLEINLSKLGADRAQNAAVRDFAKRMVTAHSAHLQAANQTGVQSGVLLAPVPTDTADAAMAGHAMRRLAATPAGPMFDQRLMQTEVMMHQHMLHELGLLRGQASGDTQALVDQTITTVRRHLGDAQAVLRQLPPTS
ncbi:MAG: hypothetical protein JWM95_3025 [Gemmatimonadetes bacterium]|nr:hypothetical protein [Gemmatimonadota bacterium]